MLQSGSEVRDLKIGFQQKILQFTMTKIVMKIVTYYPARMRMLWIYSPYILAAMQVNSF